jgi:trans-2,3-dihydro-3-hydroxyanthranilate isomerase
MAGLNFYIVDVFARAKYAGNQLAVFVNAGGIADEEMQQIAREINYSETTFILDSQEKNGGYDVRIFTPKRELPFAGHPTLGTAYVLMEAIVLQKQDAIALNLQVGQIPVTRQQDEALGAVFWMQQQAPSFGQKLDGAAIAEVLNLTADDLDSRLPIQEVSTGIPFIIVPLKTHAALKRARVNRDKYFQLIEATQAKDILIFCPETDSPENDLSVRVFADYEGIPEDPATGSANGCLAGYLVQYSYFNRESIDLRVEQGYEIGRPSLLLLQAQQAGAGIAVSVGGTVVMVAKGEWM